MFLKEIRTHGFKSFADKITFEMKKGITCIVGPNGSGKSNVVDAVRWVLGEQSVKSLRGDGNMADVIFSGSKSRNPVNIASVNLIFDNTDHYMNLPTTEVSIKRMVYRDGTNEYFLNGEKCRLKDITDILLDTGVAKESFNIISQGKIEEILSSKPIERRTIFEEAAGVLKYKKRKEEALAKLSKTNDNINRVDDIINELKLQVEPLSKQKEKAKEYIEYTDKLKNLEISLLASDITNINYKYEKNKEKLDALNKELEELNITNNTKEASLSKYKFEINKLEQDIALAQQKLLETTKKVEKLNGEKLLITERQKYQVEDIKLHDNLLALKEKKLNMENELSKMELEISSLEKDFEKVSDTLSQRLEKLGKIKQEKKKIDDSISSAIRNNSYLDLKIDELNESIEQNSFLPLATRKVLGNTKLKGIHDAFGNLLTTDEEYLKAITTSIGSSYSNIVIDDEGCAKEIINYLKVNNFGRVTLYPLNIMKPKYVDETILRDVCKLDGFIDIGSNLVTYDKKYEPIVQNQLGNVIVARNIDDANKISKKINYKYKVVTLDGEVLNVGGSITGGSVKQIKNMASQKYELEKMLKEKEANTLKIKTYEEQINDIDKKYKEVEDEIYLINRDKVNLQELFKNKTDSLVNMKRENENLQSDIDGTNNLINHTLNSEEEKILQSYYVAIKEKDELSLTLENLNKEKKNLNDLLTEQELEMRRENALYNGKSKEIKDLEIEINRFDVKLDNLLNTLSEEYSMTYEKAISTYKLEIDEDDARTIVSNLKTKIKNLGPVNIDAISEFDRVNERYEFLNRQKDDLKNAESTLLSIIDELDEVMKKEFTENFNLIRKNFNETFKELFKGGNADLKLLEPDNILESGIDIVASPPGKKLTTISLLSGGEKTFTAISLVFAILKSRPVPFCIFDEVEAALDDANVDSFGKYLKGLTDKTQFILITHKKKTMEYADVLYGMTMQESGVSKLVSVRLEDINE